MSPNYSTIGTIYDPKIQDIFEDWVIESGLKIKFNVVSYLIESSKEKESLLQRFGLKTGTEKRVLNVVTNQPDILIGIGANLLERYRKRFKEEIEVIDDVIVSEVKDQERILRGVKKKLKIR